MRLKIILPILLLNFSIISILHQNTYAEVPYLQSQSTQINKEFINEWVQYQNIVLMNQLEKLNLEESSIELDHFPNEKHVLKALGQMLQHHKNSIARLEKLQLRNTQLKELNQLNIQEHKFDLQDLEDDFGITKTEYENDEYMTLLNEKHYNYITYIEREEALNQKMLSMILHNPILSQNENNTQANLVNDWFRYQNALNKIDELHKKMDASSSRYLKEADEVAAQELKQKIDQYPHIVQKISEQVQPKSLQVTEQIKQLNASLELTREYLRDDYAMLGIDGLIESNDSDKPKNKSLGQDYFELTQKLKKNEYQIEKEVLDYLRNNPLK